MCGIYGCLRASGIGSIETVSVIAHRGPDGSGRWFSPDRTVYIAHERLAILDLSDRGAQPMWHPDGRSVVIFNGEIYNYPELKRELENQGVRFRTECDTEVLLHLYARDGEGFLARLNGMFAFALWDVSARRMLIARDGMGVKPLYFSSGPGRFEFSSELKSMLMSEGVDLALDPQGVSDYLSYLYAPAPTTLLKGVRKLEPGHAMWVTPEGLEKKWRFYELPYDLPIREGLDEETAAAELRAVLKGAVKRQMLSDAPVGAFLSGGLDSSALVVFAREHAKDGRLPCFTIGVRGQAGTQSEGFADDLPYAVRVAAHLKTPLHTVWVGQEMAKQLEFMLWHLDEPQADPAALNAYAICRQARADGVKVLLSGAGGDDLFTGYRRHYALLSERRWAWMPTGIRKALRVLTGRAPADTTWGRRLAKAFQYADYEPDRRLVGYFTWLHQSWLHDLLAPEWKRAFCGLDPMAPMLDALAKLPSGMPQINRMLYLDTKFFLADHNLNYTDKMSMAAGIEVRVPFLDPDVVRFAARLPISLKQRGHTGKWILKKAMEPDLPHDVIYRPKSGFGVPLRSWLRNELVEVVEDTLSDVSLMRRGIFDPVTVRKMRSVDLAGQADFTYPIFTLVCMELWFRLFRDGEGLGKFGPGSSH